MKHGGHNRMNYENEDTLEADTYYMKLEKKHTADFGKQPSVVQYRM